MLLAVLTVLAACADPAPAPSVRGVTILPSAERADPGGPLAIDFETDRCEGCPHCDVDPAGLGELVSLSPAPPDGLRVRLDPVGCRAVITAPGALEPDTSYTLRLAAGLRNLDGAASGTPFEQPVRTGPVFLDPAPAPRFLGTWPADGDERLGTVAPVWFLFDREVTLGGTRVLGGGEVRLSVEASRHALVIEPAAAWSAGAIELRVEGVRSGASAPIEAAASVRLTRPASSDRAVPTFAGVAAIEAVEGAFRVSWLPASDDVSAPERLRYFVYVASADGRFDMLVPDFVTAPGETSLELVAASGSGVIVRAQDEAGNVDANERVRRVP